MILFLNVNIISPAWSQNGLHVSIFGWQSGAPHSTYVIVSRRVALEAA
jgi:hypothetical protein